MIKHDLLVPRFYFKGSGYKDEMSETERNIKGYASRLTFITRSGTRLVDDPKDGDVVFCNDTQETYCFIGNEWMPLGGLSSEESEPVETITGELKELTCNHCGAPLIRSPYSNNIKCEYCGSSYWLH